jgi:hypothetical protein
MAYKSCRIGICINTRTNRNKYPNWWLLTTKYFCTRLTYDTTVCLKTLAVILEHSTRIRCFNLSIFLDRCL